MPKYTIKITETRTVERDVGHKWVGSRGGEEQTESGYTPSHMAPVEETVERYEQTVDAVDIPAIVAIVNGVDLNKIGNDIEAIRKMVTA